MSNLIIFGGTFDPIHNGHINTAINVQNYFHFDRFIFLPCKVPVLKDNAQASTTQRLEMLRLAIEETNKSELHFEIDTREINRETPSYMVTTLEDYRAELGNTIAISLLLGIDAFATLPQWYQWGRLLQLANILVISRPGYQLKSQCLRDLLNEQETYKAKHIQKRAHGLIYQFNAGLYNLSSTAVRAKIKHDDSINSDLPISVGQYIKKNQVYR
ncbi:nicotinate-nucleotide adenylyltransferase [Legionella busanensis]|uniref:Probable nicotinate-nucleotide adenylyltransferase n=1 Tax=Legionella busanensis TaxID=190655 RepID=A0A378JLT5_9GAMM|nr:nicotinate-nucleotide adenylyltransferase [Legionella busanensis]STX51263.1 nicotinate-nucleotide adenylyltransferase [Legionella busanensis]